MNDRFNKIASHFEIGVSDVFEIFEKVDLDYADLIFMLMKFKGQSENEEAM